MFNLDPGKLLVIAVVAIILLGPDKLPQVARQVGGAWRTFNEFRHRMESEVRSTMPDLPPTSEIARLARSPSALLNHLSNMSTEDEDGEGPRGEAPDGSFQPPGPPDGQPDPPVVADGGVPQSGVADARGADDTVAANGANPNGANPNGAPPEETPRANGPVPQPPVRAEHRATTSSPQPSDAIVPGDPSLN